MKIEILCGKCGNGYLVDEADIPHSGGELPCAFCGEILSIGPGEVFDDVDSRIKSSQASSPPAARRAQPADQADEEEVACPRCGLHFVPSKKRSDSTEKQRRKVLIVEHNDFFLEAAREALAGTYQVVTAGTMSEVLKIVTAGGIDAMVLDIKLGGGEEGLGVLLQLQPKPCPILILAAEDQEEMYGEWWDQLQALGADDLVLKGMQLGENLARKVAELLGEDLDDDDLAGTG